MKNSNTTANQIEEKLITPDQVERLDRFFKEKIETDEDYRKLGRDFPGENFFVL